MLREDLVFTQKHFESKEDAILFLAEQFKEKGYVYETFANALVEREEKYPTGLYLGEINVAIPYTETKHVKQSGMAILTLNKSVILNRMGGPSQTIPIHIIFLLAVAELNEYIEFLPKFMDNLTNEKVVKKIYDGKTGILKVLSLAINKGIAKKEGFYWKLRRLIGTIFYWMIVTSSLKNCKYAKNYSYFALNCDLVRSITCL
jgi:PTS system galactitol-specific IIA component